MHLGTLLSLLDNGGVVVCDKHIKPRLRLAKNLPQFDVVQTDLSCEPSEIRDRDFEKLRLAIAQSGQPILIGLSSARILRELCNKLPVLLARKKPILCSDQPDPTELPDELEFLAANDYAAYNTYDGSYLRLPKWIVGRLGAFHILVAGHPAEDVLSERFASFCTFATSARTHKNQAVRAFVDECATDDADRFGYLLDASRTFLRDPRSAWAPQMNKFIGRAEISVATLLGYQLAETEHIVRNAVEDTLTRLYRFEQKDDFESKLRSDGPWMVPFGDDDDSSARPAAELALNRQKLVFLLVAETPGGAANCLKSWLATRSDDYDWTLVVAVLAPSPSLLQRVHDFAHQQPTSIVGDVAHSQLGIIVEATERAKAQGPRAVVLVREATRFTRPNWDKHILASGFDYGLKAIFASSVPGSHRPLFQGSADRTLGAPTVVVYNPAAVPEISALKLNWEEDINSHIWRWSYRMRCAGVTWIDAGNDLAKLGAYMSNDPGTLYPVPALIKNNAMLIALVSKAGSALDLLRSCATTFSPALKWSILVVPVDNGEPGDSLLSFAESKSVHLYSDEEPTVRLQHALEDVFNEMPLFCVVMSDKVRFTAPGWDEHLLAKGFEWNLTALVLPNISKEAESSGDLAKMEGASDFVAFNPLALRDRVPYAADGHLWEDYREWLQSLESKRLIWKNPGDDLNQLRKWMEWTSADKSP